MKSISLQMRGLSAKQYSIIGNHLYLVYGVGFDAATKSSSNQRPVIRTDNKDNIRRFDSLTLAAKSVGMDKNNLRKRMLTKTRYSHGYTWNYEI